MLMCDAWEAGNHSSYFAITGHYIEEKGPKMWVMRTSLLGLPHFVSVHTGKRLGQMLFKVVDRAGAAKKVSNLFMLMIHTYLIVLHSLDM